MSINVDHLKNRFTLFVADNVERNTDTMDVKELFMGWAVLLIES